jgi:hypothetical protein
MAFRVQKTEHSGPKHGRGALWGTKYEAKSQSGKIRRRNNKRQIQQEQDSEQESIDPRQELQSLEEQITKLQRKKPYRIVKAISESTDELITGRYEGPLDPDV